MSRGLAASGAAGFFDGFLAAVAVDVHFEDGGVMDEAVDGGERHGLAWKGWLAVMSRDRRSYRALISSNGTLVSA